MKPSSEHISADFLSSEKLWSIKRISECVSYICWCSCTSNDKHREKKAEEGHILISSEASRDRNVIVCHSCSIFSIPQKLQWLYSVKKNISKEFRNIHFLLLISPLQCYGTWLVITFFRCSFKHAEKKRTMIRCCL